MKVSELLFEKTLIKQKWKTDQLSVEKAIDLLNVNCKRSLKDIARGTILWRGMNDIGKVASLDSSKAHRTSKDTNNLYQLAMETSASMKNVPFRSRSFICASDGKNAMSYGEIYAIFPYDDTTIAISDTSDFITTFLNDYGLELSDFSYQLGEALSTLKIPPQEGGKYTDAVKIDSSLAAFDPHLTFFVIGQRLMAFKSFWSASNDFISNYNNNVKTQKIISTEGTSIVNMHRSGKLDMKQFVQQVKRMPMTEKGKNFCWRFLQMLLISSLRSQVSISLQKP